MQIEVALVVLLTPTVMFLMVTLIVRAGVDAAVGSFGYSDSTDDEKQGGGEVDNTETDEDGDGLAMGVKQQDDYGRRIARDFV